jgi:ABC-type branched-subunit amino acid transport system ATPase component/branched-subunit amino acid ABC-type transport system permease component
MSEFLSLCLSGAVSGAIVSIVASVLVLSYSTTGIFNFSLGAVSFSTAYVFFLLNTGFHWPVWLSAVVAVAIYSPLIGLLLDKFVLRALARAPEVPRIIGTVGLLLAIPAIWLFIVESVAVGGFHANLPLIANVQTPAGLGPNPEDMWSIAGNTLINSDQVVILIAAVISGSILWVIVRHTRIGLTMRATVDRHQLAELRGVNTVRVSATASILSAVLAGLAGVVAAPVIGLSPGNFNLILFVAAGSAVLGGFRSIPLAFLGGLLLGILEDLFGGYASRGIFANIAGLGTALPSIVLLIGLLVLGRSRRRSAGQTVESIADTDAPSDLRLWRQRAPWLLAVAAFVIYLTVFASSYWQFIGAEGIALGFVFLSITLITGLGGIVSLAQGTFAGASGLFMCYLFSNFGWPLVPAAVGGIAVAVGMGILVALPSLRLEGLALTLASLALSLIGTYLFFQLPFMQNNGAGWSITPPNWGPLHLGDQKELSMVYLVLLGCGCVVVRNVRRSLTGRATLIVRSSTAAAQSVGIYPARTKLYLFALCAAFAGFGGVLLALQLGTQSPDAYPATTSMIWVAVAVVFGVEQPAGAVIAGLVTAFVPAIIANYTSSPYIPEILFGLGAIGLANHPEGAISQLTQAGRQRRLKRRRRAQSLQDGTSIAAAIDASPTSSLVGTTIDLPTDFDIVSTTEEGFETALHLVSVFAGYGEIEVIRGIDIRVGPGTITVLLGANGAGKSTLCSMIAGVIPCSGGQVLLGATDITRLPPHERVQLGMSLVPEGRGVFPSLTVEENLEVWLPNRKDREVVFSEFPILAWRRAQIGWNLSGGEQQLLSLAPMIVQPPKVLIADEPTLGLAPLAVAQVMGLFQRLREQGVCVLLVEEKTHAVLEVADDVAIIELGRIVWQGKPVALDKSTLLEAYLGKSGR